MSFDRRDIRPSMDVYTRDNLYIGSVIKVFSGPESPVKEHVLPEARQASEVNGELLGPMPTQTIGNTGPTRQAANAQYATIREHTESLGQGRIEVGKWWGLVGRRTIPLAAVQTVSLERVVLQLRKDELEKYLS